MQVEKPPFLSPRGFFIGIHGTLLESSDLGGVGGTTYGLLGNLEGNDAELGNVHQAFIGQFQFGNHGEG